MIELIGSKLVHCISIALFRQLIIIRVRYSSLYGYALLFWHIHTQSEFFVPIKSSMQNLPCHRPNKYRLDALYIYRLYKVSRSLLPSLSIGSEIFARSNAVLPEGEHHLGGGLGAAASLPLSARTRRECVSALPTESTSSRHPLHSTPADTFGTEPQTSRSR